MTLAFDEYQTRAQETDQKPGDSQDALVMALLGLVGEAGTLLSEYKKRMRDGEAHRGFQSQVGEELGDILWYVANIATKCGASLSNIATRNLSKTRGRWLPPEAPAPLLDEDQASGSQLPREFELTFVYRDVQGVRRVVVVDASGETIGDSLTDNAYIDDGYRFHDVLHLAFAAGLGWSPVFRKLLRKKGKVGQRSPAVIDEVEDGGRAQVIEEGIAAAIYEYAARHDFMNVARVDWDLLRVAKRLTSHLEVSRRSEAEWERAILMAFDVWRKIRDADGGRIRGDLRTQRLEFVPT